MTIRDFLRTSDDLTLQQWATRFKTTADQRAQASGASALECDMYAVRCANTAQTPQEVQPQSLPSLGMLTIISVGEENMYFRTSDGIALFCKCDL